MGTGKLLLFVGKEHAVQPADKPCLPGTPAGGAAAGSGAPGLGTRSLSSGLTARAWGLAMGEGGVSLSSHESGS